MTWLRFDADAAQSDVVGHLAEALGIPAPHAFGCYVACCLGFGAHRPDGRAGHVSDTTLEQWALWVGKRGRFAAAFRARCVAEDGTIRGWWRQEKLLNRQQEKNTRPGQKTRETRHKPGTNPAQERAGNDTIRDDRKISDDDDPNVQNSAAAAAGSEAVFLGLSPEGAQALTGLLRASQNPAALLAEVRALTQGMRGPFTAAHVSAALHDLTVAGIPRPTAAQLRGFTRRAAAPEPVPTLADEPDGQRLARIAAKMTAEDAARARGVA